MKEVKMYAWGLLLCFISSILHSSNSRVLVSEKKGNWNIVALAAPVVAVAMGVNCWKLHQQSKLLQNQALEIERLKKTVASRDDLDSCLKKIEQEINAGEYATKAAFIRTDLEREALVMHVKSLENQMQGVESRLQEMLRASKDFVQRRELGSYQEQVIQEILDSVEKAIAKSGFITRADLEERSYDNRASDLSSRYSDSSSSGMGSRKGTQQFLQEYSSQDEYNSEYE